MSPEMGDAIRRVASLHVGDRVVFVGEETGGQPRELMVSQGPRRADGKFGSPEGTRATLSYGPGRYSFEVVAERVAAGRQSISVVAPAASPPPYDLARALELAQDAADVGAL